MQLMHVEMLQKESVCFGKRVKQSCYKAFNYILKQ